MVLLVKGGDADQRIHGIEARLMKECHMLRELTHSETKCVPVGTYRGGKFAPTAHFHMGMIGK